ncbi:minor capsid protein [Paenibacillus sp. BK720]|uniref:minor capsid protein n=1 Tax=Paenibacillus sp. BK720 TaxID=2587092 RepID=UPI0014217573|nr:minor capsid protein [Paenibacillus sp. BK720]NIK67925.1 SPP1 gp7 family putative phage head morphogenesis protein [Paenibacillus sp. BK720]
MPTGKPKPLTRTAEQKRRQKEVLERMQRDMDGYVDKYQEILDKRAAQYAGSIEGTWQRIGRQLSQAIQDLYDQYADKDGQLDDTRLRERQRLQFLRQHVAKVIYQLRGQEDVLRNNLAYTYAESAVWHSWALEQATQLSIITPALTYGHVMGVLANPWLPDGATYSERLRANTAFLAAKMRDSITEAVGQGWDVQRAARRIQEVAGEGYHNSVRLARTEMNRAASQASSHTFMQNADLLDGKRWRATLDARTAPKDARNDGQVYELDYDTPERPGRAGERIPNHPNCRCKYSPVVSGVSEKVRDRIARGDGDAKDEFGERIYTKAKDYREYAKERGLPNLDESLAKDNPKRYLRPGEDDDAYNIPSGRITKPAAAKTAKDDLDNASSKKPMPKPAEDPPPVKRPADLLRQDLTADDFDSPVTASEFFKAMDIAPETFVEFTRKLYKRSIYKMEPTTGGSYYMRSSHTVAMSQRYLDSFKAGESDPGYKQAITTLIHEVGHGLDYGLSKHLTGQDIPDGYKYASGVGKFAQAVAAAKAYFVDQLKKSKSTWYIKAKAKYKTQAKQDEVKAEYEAAVSFMQLVVQKVQHEYKAVSRVDGKVIIDARYSGLSDIFDGITEKLISGGMGHAKDYWKRDGTTEAEVFTNLYEMHVSNNQESIGVMREIFPDILNAFLGLIEEGAKA